MSVHGIVVAVSAREDDPRDAETADPHTGTSDDPRVDPTQERRRSEQTTSSKRNAFGVPDPTAEEA